MSEVQSGKKFARHITEPVPVEPEGDQPQLASATRHGTPNETTEMPDLQDQSLSTAGGQVEAESATVETIKVSDTARIGGSGD